MTEMLLLYLLLIFIHQVLVLFERGFQMTGISLQLFQLLLR